MEIQKWCEEGFTNDVICERLDISESTWYEYEKNYPVPLELVQASKGVANFCKRSDPLQRLKRTSSVASPYASGESVRKSHDRFLRKSQ